MTATDPEVGWDEEAARADPKDILLVPGANGPLRVGIDDAAIKRQHVENLTELEDEPVDVRRFYVATVETKYNRFDREQTINRPHNILIASTMRDAIKLFEDENGHRLWLPWTADSRFTLQLGIGRVAQKHVMVRIEKIRKDCVLA